MSWMNEGQEIKTGLINSGNLLGIEVKTVGLLLVVECARHDFSLLLIGGVRLTRCIKDLITIRTYSQSRSVLNII